MLFTLVSAPPELADTGWTMTQNALGYRDAHGLP